MLGPRRGVARRPTFGKRNREDCARLRSTGLATTAVSPLTDAMPLIDISRPLYTGSPHWPGDHATVYELGTRMADGAMCNVGHLSLSVHNGTHADAPFHYNERGLRIDALAPDLFVGPARVIDAR